MNPDYLKSNLPPDRKTLIRMRMELRRQQMRKEVLRVAEPIVKLQSGYEKLSNSYLPLIGLAGTALTSLLIKSKTNVAIAQPPVQKSSTWLTLLKAAVPIAGTLFGLYKARQSSEQKQQRKDPFSL